MWNSCKLILVIDPILDTAFIILHWELYWELQNRVYFFLKIVPCSKFQAKSFKNMQSLFNSKKKIKKQGIEEAAAKTWRRHHY